MRKLVTGAVTALFAFGLYESLKACADLIWRPETPRSAMFVYPSWSAIHFVAAVLFTVLVPLQLWRSFRERHRALHRIAGRVVFAAALVLGASGLAMVHVLPGRPPAERMFFTVYFAAFLFFLGKAFTNARRGNLARHREWVLRMIATAAAAMTQRLIFPLLAMPLEFQSHAEFWSVFLTAAWLAWGMNLALTEWWLDASRATAGSPSAAGYSRPTPRPA